MGKSRTLIRIAVLAVIFAAVGVALYNTAFKDDQVIKQGAPAPDFVLPVLGGETMKLSDLRGQGVVLNFWGTWCPPCREEMPALDSAHQKFKDKGVQVIGVNIGESDVVVSSFMEKYQLSFPMLMDRNSEISRLYQVGNLPQTVFIDGEGMINRVVVGGPMPEDAIIDYMNQILPQ